MSNIRSNHQLALQFKALANPHRLAMLQRLTTCCPPGTVCDANGAGAYVGEVGRGLGIAPSTLSHHLKELATAGFINTRRQGKNVQCRVEPQPLIELADLFRSLAGQPPNQGETAMPHDADNEQTRDFVRQKYAEVAQGGLGCLPGCCGATAPSPQDMASLLGYSPEDMAAAPEGSNLGLGCGNPQAMAALRPGEVVLDLGAGAGFDCFIAARQVGTSGRVIGVDMTPEMLAKARANARQVELANVEFRLGEIEHLPVADASVDVILSNCVVNLSPDKSAVYAEAFRVLRPAGRLAISDVVALEPLPEDLQRDLALWAGCAAGALAVDVLTDILRGAGFDEVKVEVDQASREMINHWTPGKELGRWLASVRITAFKPAD